jgi:hypothetical protein
MPLSGRDIFAEMEGFIRGCPKAFPAKPGRSWSHPLIGFFYWLGIRQGFESRCGDWYASIQENCTGHNLTALPDPYQCLAQQWSVNGLLDTDLAWVPPRFTIPKDFSSQPNPDRSEIHLIYEHEDEHIYTDQRGTNVVPVVDEIRKIGNVLCPLKVVSYITTRREIEEGRGVRAIQEEVRRIPERAVLTKEWCIIPLAKYTAPTTRKQIITVGGNRVLYIKCFRLSPDGDIVEEIEADVPYPG